MARSAKVIFALSLVASSAYAEDPAVVRADRFFKDGRRAAEHGDYAQACKLFEESFRLDPGVGTLINLGDCAEHLGDLERAYGNYRTAYARMSETDDRAPRVRARIESIEQKAAKLAIHLDADAPEGTVVTVDGVVVDPKKSLHVAKGTHVVLVTAVGYRGARYNVNVDEGEVRALHVSPGTPLEAVLPTAIEHKEAAPSHAASWTRPTGIVAIGLGAASLWVGSLAGMMAIDRRDVQSDLCGPQGCTQAGVNAAREGATWATVSTATFIAGGALVAAGAALVLVSLSPHKNVSVGFGTSGVLVAGTFR